MTSISANGATDTIYITDIAGTVSYKINNGSFSTISWPVTITNNNTSAVLKVLFLSNLSLSTDPNRYLRANSSHIQFGDTNLSSTGERVNITVNIANYDGFIQNGDSGENGYNNISIYNLNVDGTGGSLQIGAGWVAKQFFANSVSECYIVNCSSSGDIPDNGGGIVGRYAGTGSGGSLTLRGCSSSGVSSQLAGNIVGAYAGSSSGSITCEQCFSEGVIGAFAGGILGDYAGDGGSATATKCYSTGAIGGNGGGIYGRYGGNNGSAVADRCYSLGSIGADGGGIYGLGAAATLGIAVATNCYSSGSIATSGNGIYGTGRRVAGSTTTNCYTANGSWSDSTASTSLTGTPGASDVGTTWVKRGSNVPYELNGFGATPYTTTVINSSGDLIQSFSQTVEVGQNTVSALNADASGNAFSVLKTSGGTPASYGTLTISAQTGAISTTSATVPGTYTFTIRSVGSYFITTFVLTVSPQAAPAAVTSTGCCSSTIDERGLSYEWITDYKIGNRLISEVSQNPKTTFDGYSEYVKYKMAKGARKY